MADGQKKAPIGKTKALFDFTAENDGELSFKTDDIIWVLDKDDVGEWDGWWEGRCERTQQEGFFPADGWVEELPFTPSGDGSAIVKPALPTAPKPPIKGRMSGPVAGASSDSSGGSVIVASPASSPPPASENGSKKQETATTTTTTDNGSTISKDNKKDDKKNNKKDKDNTDDKPEEDKPAKEDKPKEKEKDKPPKKEKPKPKRKAPRKGRAVELGDPYGFKKVAGFERRAGQAPEEQIAKLYNQSAEELVAMLEPHDKQQTETKDVAPSSPTSPTPKEKEKEKEDKKEKDKDKERKRVSKQAAKEEKRRLDEEKKKADEERKRADEEAKRLEEERKKKEKEEKKKAKEDAKKNNKGKAAERKASQKNVKQSSKKNVTDLKDDKDKAKPSKEEPKEEVLPPPSRIVKPSPPPMSGGASAPKISPRPLPVSTGDPLLDFLTAVKLESLHQTFKNEEMEFPDDFIGISHEELTTLGIKMGPRRRIIMAMQQYQKDGRISVDLMASQTGALDGGEGEKGGEKESDVDRNNGKMKEKEPDKDGLDRRGGSNNQGSPRPCDGDGSSKITLPLKSIKKEEGWVFPADAAEEGVTAMAKNDGQEAKKVESESGQKPAAGNSDTSASPRGGEASQNSASKEFYSLAELTAKNLPPGVDPAKLETYLSPKDFSDAFGMTKEAFNACPEWRRRKLKLDKKLF